MLKNLQDSLGERKLQGGSEGSTSSCCIHTWSQSCPNLMMTTRDSSCSTVKPSALRSQPLSSCDHTAKLTMLITAQTHAILIFLVLIGSALTERMA